jgi:hypothetical protein
MSGDNQAKRRATALHAKRELEQMSDWELERGLASSAAFDDDQRSIADRILKARYGGFEVGITLWILAIALGAGLVALIE